MQRPFLFLFALPLAVGCAAGNSGDAGGGGGFDGGPSGFDAGPAGFDAGPTGFDAGPIDFDGGSTGTDAGSMGTDAGTVGLVDAGFDGGTVGLIDAGFDAGSPGTDAGGPPPGGTIELTSGFMTTVTGDTTGGTIWNRPVASGSCPATTLSAVATMVPYETRLIHNGTSGTLTVTIGSTASYDGYLIIYLGTTVPADPLTCHAADDDGGTSPDPLVTFTLNAGETAVVVQSGFNNTDVGAYAMTISAT